MPIIKAIHYKSQYVCKAKTLYILKDGQDHEQLIDKNTLLLNFTETNPKILHRDYLKQAKYLKKRKNGNKLFHFIVSFSPKDNLSHATLMDMMHKFIELRGLTRNVVLGKIHNRSEKNKHQHFHILASSNALREKRPIRYGKAKFRQLFIDLETYAKEKHGKEIVHSYVVINKKERVKEDLTKRDKNSRKEREYQLKLRLDGKSKTKKQIAKDILDGLLEKSNGFDQFAEKLKSHEDFDLYSYRGKIKGCWFEGRKFRFKTLGIELSRINELERMEERLKQLSLLRETFKGQDRGLER